MEFKKKKGIQLNQAFGAVLVLVLVAVLVIIGIFIFVALQSSLPDIATSSVNLTTPTVVNSTVTAFVANASLCNFNNFVITRATNATTAEIITSANYTTTSLGGILLVSENAGDSSWNNTLWNVTSTYTRGGSACDATEEMTSQFGNYPVLIGLVGTIIFLGLVIGVLVASFVFGGKNAV